MQCQKPRQVGADTTQFTFLGYFSA
uniref:Uncharacterized protein n=1 Tax=Anguilla anguilla TaxID=7936 RepID=A0A0E9XUZ7_ANGAN